MTSPKPAPTVQIVPPSTEETQARPRISNDLPIDSVGVVIGYTARDGVREVVHQVNGSEVEIISCVHSVEKKMRACKEDGQLIGYEPTGEETLTLKVKYIRNA